MKYAWFLLMIVGGTSSLWAAPTLVLTEGQEKYPLGLHLEILEDKVGKWTLQDVSSPELSKQFKNSQQKIPNYGFTSSVYWVRFRVKNSLNRHIHVFVELAYPTMNQVEWYAPQDSGGYQQKITGDHLPFQTREISYKNFIFSTEEHPGKHYTYYMRFQSNAINLPLTLWFPKALMQKMNTEQTVLGIYYGTMLVMLIYNFFLFLALRDPGYLHYVFYLGGYTLFQLILNGMAFQYLWPHQVWWANNSLLFFGCFGCFWAQQFTRSFLNTQQNVPILDKVFKLLMGATALGMIFSLVNYSLSIQPISILIIASVIMGMFTGLACWFKGYRPAIYYIVAWSIFLVGVMLYLLKSFGILPANFVTNWAIQIGSSLEVILLSLGLADRINVMKKEQKAHEKIVTLEKEATERQMAGGFAHEIRNALAGSKLITDEALGYNGSKPYVSLNLENSRKLKEMYTQLKEQLGEEKLQSLLVLMKSIFSNEEKLDKILIIISQSLSRGLSITQQIMEYSEIGFEYKGKLPVNLDQLIERVVEENFQDLRDHAIKVQLNLRGKDNQIIGNEDHFYAILKHLISNARDALLEKLEVENEEKIIEIRSEIIEKQYRIRVFDNGVGIPLEHFSKIDEAFFSTKPEKGTGLGLGMVKKIVSLYEGTMTMESEVGQKTVFTVTLPIKTSS